MDEMSRDGHRQRAKEKLLSTPIENVYDYQLLEALLFYSVPRMDVKPVAYELINHFGNLERVLSASVDDLMRVDGIGENSATLIKLSKKLCEKIEINKNEDITKISDYIQASEYASNILKDCEFEKFLIITLNNNMEIISNTVIAQGYSNHAKIEPFKIVERAINDKATALIVAHNHPYGEPLPSAKDVNFTLQLISLLKPLQINLCDHIIVTSRDCGSMSIMPEYYTYFRNSKQYSYIDE